MKKIIVFISFLCIIFSFTKISAQVQTSTNPQAIPEEQKIQQEEPKKDTLMATPIDGITDMSEKFNKTPTPYPYVRDADIGWQKRIWRVIDLREKMNQPLYYPETPHNHWKSLMTVFLDAIKEGSLTAYDAAIGDEFITPLSYKELLERVESKQTTQMQRPDPPYDYYDTVISIKLEPTAIKKYRIKEDWFFDKQRSMFEVRIIGICPVVDVLDEKDGTLRAYKPLFWIYFPEARPILAKAEVFNRFNSAARFTYDDYFWKRLFSSYIYKEDNQYDRTIGEYAKGVDRILESDRVKEELFNFEQFLWEY